MAEVAKPHVGRNWLLIIAAIVVIFWFVSCSHIGQKPSAECFDGTYSYSQHHEGTCSHHGGVQYWNP